jgi:hypothetical protein
LSVISATTSFSQFPILASQVFDFVARGFSDRVARQLFLARFEKVLAPSVVEVGSDPFSATQVGDALLAPQTFEEDPDLLFGRELPSTPPTDLSRRRFSGLLLLVRHLDTHLGVTQTPECVS